MSTETLSRACSSPLSTGARTRRSKRFRRNTLAALAVSLIILGFLATPGKPQVVNTQQELRGYRSVNHPSSSAEDVLHQLQHHTLTVEECNGSKCTREVVNVHDTAMLNGTANLQTGDRLNSSESRLGTVTIQKQVGKPLVVTVKKDESDPGLQVQSGGELLTDEARVRVASLHQVATQSNLSLTDSSSAEAAANIAENLGKHGAAAHHEGDNVLDIHRDDIDLSTSTVNPVSVNVTDDNNLRIMLDTNSSSLLSGFNSEKGRDIAQQEQQQQQLQQQDPSQKIDAAAESGTEVALDSANRRLHAHRPLLVSA